MEKFPESLVELRRHDSSQWDIGEKIVKECGAPSQRGKKDKSLAKIAELALLCEQEGLDYSENTLRTFRDISYLYRNVVRTTFVSWSIYYVVRSPEILERVLAECPKPWTVKNVSKWAKNYRTKRLEEQPTNLSSKASAYKAADDALKTAQKQEKEAEQAAAAATNDIARAQAEAKKAAAQKEAQKAAEEKVANRRPPRKSPEKTAVGATLCLMIDNCSLKSRVVGEDVIKLAAESDIHAKKATKLYETNGHTVVSEQKPAIIEYSLEAFNELREAANKILQSAELWRELAIKIQNENQNHNRSHLSVVTQELETMP